MQNEETLAENILEWLQPRWQQRRENNEKFIKAVEAERDIVKEVLGRETLTEDDQNSLRESLERLDRAVKIHAENAKENIF